MPTVRTLDDIGKPIYDDGSGNAPIFGGSTPVGVYLDEVWIEAELLSNRSVIIFNDTGIGSTQGGWEPVFSGADARLENSYTQSAFENTIKTAYSTYQAYKRVMLTQRNVQGDGTYYASGWTSFFRYPAFVYRVPSSISISSITGIFISLSSDSKLSFISNAFVYALDSLTDIDNKLTTTEYTGYTDVSLDTSVSAVIPNKLILIIPNGFGSNLSESDYTKTVNNNAIGEPGDITWNSGDLSIGVTQVLLRVKA